VAEVAGESASDTTARAQSVNEPCTAQQIERVKQVLIQMKQVNPKVIAEYKAALAALGLTETAQFTQNECERLIVSLEAKQMEDFFSKLGAQRKANP
jgi:nitrate reductase NapAB chaperone NapD